MTYSQLFKSALIGIAATTFVGASALAESQLGAGTPQNPQSEGTRVTTQAQIDRGMRGGHFTGDPTDSLMWVGPYKDTRASETASNAAALAAIARQEARGHWTYAGGDLMWVPGTAQLAKNKK